jgi:prepilin-type N-terminal cleavage/methylation domain-containing protein
MKKGFTLIELLVVVLIIGILSAVALPQYTLAVEKSRLAEALSISKYVQNAISVRYLECGGERECMYRFDEYLELPALKWDGRSEFEGKNFSYDFDQQIYIVQKKGDYEFSFAGWDWPDVIEGKGKSCQPFTSLGEKICKQLERDGYEYVN